MKKYIMKWKTVIPIIMMACILGCVIVSAMLLATSLEGVEKQISDLQRMPIWKAFFFSIGISFLFIATVCVLMLKKLDVLDEIDTQADSLEKEKEQYKQATIAFVKMYKIETKDLL